jgi:hypothetical protein
MKFTDERFLKFIQSGATGKTHYCAQHKDLKDKKVYIVLSSFNFSGTPRSNVYSLDISEDLSDFPIRKASILINSKIQAYAYQSYVLDKNNVPNTVSLSKEQFFSTINKIGLEYPLVANFFLWNQV